MFIPCLAISFLEVTALVSLKAATICHFKGKKPAKVNIFEAIFQAKTGLNYQSNLCFSHAFGIFISCLTISFGEVTARVSLNVATNGSLTGRKISKMSIFRLLL